MFFKRLGPTEKYEDPEFGPTADDPLGKFSLYPEGEPTFAGAANPMDVIWLRPHEISKQPRFMDKDGLNASDVAQGELGDCWFVSALSAVAANRESAIMSNMDPVLLERLDSGEAVTRELWDIMDESLFSPIFHYYATKGMYVIRFSKDNEWQYVIMDDRIPCKKETRVPLYAKDKGLDEFWVSLIEKAFAKLHGNFSALKAGFIHEALGDLTGLIPLKIELNNLKEENEPTREKIDQFWNELVANSGRAVMGCSIKGSTEGQVKFNGIPCGVLSGHAYAILDAFQIKKDCGKGKSRLLRIRNPWGDTEWRGKWSDSCDTLAANKEKIIEHYKAVRKEVSSAKYHVRLTNLEKWEESAVDDGTFLICYKDWRELFSTMFICKNLFTDNEYRSVRFGYKWTSENNQGTPLHGTEEECVAWAQNPHVKISVREANVTLIICASQQDARLKGEGEFPFPGLLHPFVLCVQETEGTLQASVPMYFSKHSCKM